MEKLVDPLREAARFKATAKSVADGRRAIASLLKETGSNSLEYEAAFQPPPHAKLITGLYCTKGSTKIPISLDPATRTVYPTKIS